MLLSNMSSESDDDARKLREKIKDAPDTLTASGNTYYVSNKGNNSNNGTSPEKAWQTIEKVNSFAFAAGDVVLFERGGIFRGSLKAHSNVSYGAYGNGDKPCIYGSRANMSSAVWIEATQNIWVCETQFSNDVGIIVFNHGENVGIKKLTMDLSENYEFFHNKADGKIYLYHDNGSPQKYDCIEMGERQHIIQMPTGAENIIIENLCIKYGGAHGIGGMNFKNVTVRNCELGWIGGSIQHENVRYGNAIENWEACEDFTVENCYIYQIYDAGITHQGQEASTMNNVIFKNNLIEYCTYSIEYFQRNKNGVMSNITYEGNIMRFAGYGWGHQRPDKEEAAHIKSWNLPNGAENFVIKNNIMDLSRYNLFQIISGNGDRFLPELDGNRYIQPTSRNIGYWGKELFIFDDNTVTTVKNKYR